MMKPPELLLNCNAAGCLALPEWTPRLYVPARAAGEENHMHPPIRMMLVDIHFCEPHWQMYASVDSILRDEVKARIEHRGKQIWPEGVRPDFDAALIYKVGIYTPEFVRFIERLGYQGDGLGFSRAVVQRRHA
jgi:hypothetical protein